MTIVFHVDSLTDGLKKIKIFKIILVYNKKERAITPSLFLACQINSVSHERFNLSSNKLAQITL